MKTFKLEMYGYGGEMVLGTITKEAYEHWANREEDDEGRHHHLFWDPYEESDGNDVIDDEDETIWQTEEPEIESTTIEDPDDQPTGYYFKGWSSEKGHFFSAEFDAEEFDPKKLKFSATNVDCDVVIDSVEYDGETLDNDGGDTRGKSLGQEFYENP